MSMIRLPVIPASGNTMVMNTQSSRRPCLLLTRPQRAADAFAAATEAALPGRFEILIAPQQRIVPRPDPLAGMDLSGPGTLILTSRNGVAAAAALSGLPDLPAVTVGEKTAEAARGAGIAVRAAYPDADALVAALRDPGPEPRPMLHLSGAHHRGDIVERLQAAGQPASRIILYDQPEVPLSDAAQRALRNGRVDLLPLFSPRSAALFANAARTANWPTDDLTLIGMSSACLDPLSDLQVRARHTAARPDAASMLDALRQFAQQIGGEPL
ncbi:uroporphyrinogen-III synthase [Oceanomicrobium pacificus]|uniref:Uroporphyrinogen-III synthase n=1 Tax=Oceanomicrobium pacificus TaxID=2692916 RepID=A0A6B0TT09_9RHOB|nr:uroporphyrinogen-III synthase [Oceanomicrobium pacificus]MXU64808.1 uroporphyrinogen-III synthase [Oceanomicrobium pacificus]